MSVHHTSPSFTILHHTYHSSSVFIILHRSSSFFSILHPSSSLSISSSCIGVDIWACVGCRCFARIMQQREGRTNHCFILRPFTHSGNEEHNIHSFTRIMQQREKNTNHCFILSTQQREGRSQELASPESHNSGRSCRENSSSILTNPHFLSNPFPTPLQLFANPHQRYPPPTPPLSLRDPLIILCVEQEKK